MIAPPTLGVVAICYNEERDLPGFLKNVTPWVDEVVLVDDGSTDGTAAIVAQFGPKVKFLVKPRGAGEYYSHQRNKGIEAAKSDWLLHMDIDERVTPELATEILNRICSNRYDGFRFRRLNFFLNRPMRGGGWQRWNLVHLARRELFSFGGKMHESCLLDSPEDRVGQLASYMWHVNDNDYLSRVRKSVTYIEVETENLLESGRRVRLRHIVLRPLMRGLRRYLLWGGFRDGIPGVIFAMHCMAAVFKANAATWSAQNNVARSDVEEEILNAWRKADFNLQRKGVDPKGARGRA